MFARRSPSRPPRASAHSCGERRHGEGVGVCLHVEVGRARLARLHTAAVCGAFLLRVSVAVLLELTVLAKPVEMPCLCWNTQLR